MKTKYLFIAMVAFLTFSRSSWAQQDTLYYEQFTGGVAQLPWFSGWGATANNMEVVNVNGNPSGDHWVGKVGNNLSVDLVGTALSGNQSLTDYEVSANVYTVVFWYGGGPNNGIVARCDTSQGFSGYCLESDLDINHRLRLRSYQNGSGGNVATWVDSELPGGIPTASSWHNMKLKLQGDQIWAYWDGIMLSGSPFTNGDHSHGYFGAYVKADYNTAETRCDDILALGSLSAVKGDDPGLSATPGALALIGAYPNPFNPSTVISYQLPAFSDVSLNVFDTTGRMVRTLVSGKQSAGDHTVIWNAVGNASGVYLVQLQTPQEEVTRKVVVVK